MIPLSWNAQLKHKLEECLMHMITHYTAYAGYEFSIIQSLKFYTSIENLFREELRSLWICLYLLGVDLLGQHGS